MGYHDTGSSPREPGQWVGGCAMDQHSLPRRFLPCVLRRWMTTSILDSNAQEGGLSTRQGRGLRRCPRWTPRNGGIVTLKARVCVLTLYRETARRAY